jgi:hypothetical protein
MRSAALLLASVMVGCAASETGPLDATPAETTVDAAGVWDADFAPDVPTEASPDAFAADAAGPDGPVRQAVLVVSPKSHQFAGITNIASTPIEISVANTGDGPSGVPAFAFSGPNAGEFGVATHGCKGPILAGTDCLAFVDFRPTSAGMKQATLTVMAAPGGSATVSLTGQAVSGPDVLSVENPSVDFGSVLVGATSTPRAMLVKNSGPLPVESLQFTIASDQFFISGDGCSGAPLPGGRSCGIELRFRPTSPGEKSAVVVINGGRWGQAVGSMHGVGQ